MNDTITFLMELMISKDLGCGSGWLLTGSGSGSYLSQFFDIKVNIIDILILYYHIGQYKMQKILKRLIKNHHVQTESGSDQILKP